MKLRRFIKSWLPVLLWMIFIFVGSTDLMSSQHTSRFLVPFLHWIDPNISDATIASIQLLVRKGAHLTEYAILAALLYRAFRQGHEHLSRTAGLVFIIAAISAALDEFHQSFVPTRTASSYDVVIDVAGALAGVLIYWRAIRNRKSKI